MSGYGLAGATVPKEKFKLFKFLFAVACGSSFTGSGLAAEPISLQNLPEWARDIPGIRQPSVINGEVPPGNPTQTTSSELIMSHLNPGLARNQSLVYRDVRAPGTRSPIHVHRWGGITCVVQGLAELYIDGAARSPVTAGPGMCYMMPAMTKVSALVPINQKEPATLQDIFDIECGEPAILFIEPGHLNTGEHELASVPCSSANYMEPYKHQKN